MEYGNEVKVFSLISLTQKTLWMDLGFKIQHVYINTKRLKVDSFIVFAFLNARVWHSIVAFLRSTLCTLFNFSSPHGCIVDFDGLNNLSFFDLGKEKEKQKN